MPRTWSGARPGMEGATAEFINLLRRNPERQWQRTLRALDMSGVDTSYYSRM